MSEWAVGAGVKAANRRHEMQQVLVVIILDVRKTPRLTLGRLSRTRFLRLAYFYFLKQYASSRRNEMQQELVALVLDVKNTIEYALLAGLPNQSFCGEPEPCSKGP